MGHSTRYWHKRRITNHLERKREKILCLLTSHVFSSYFHFVVPILFLSQFKKKKKKKPKNSRKIEVKFSVSLQPQFGSWLWNQLKGEDNDLFNKTRNNSNQIWSLLITNWVKTSFVVTNRWWPRRHLLHAPRVKPELLFDSCTMHGATTSMCILKNNEILIVSKGRRGKKKNEFEMPNRRFSFWNC